MVFQRSFGKKLYREIPCRCCQSCWTTGQHKQQFREKTCISRLMDAEILVNYVAQLSGHKNLKSLDAYKATSTVHQHKMSNVFSQKPATSRRSDETCLAQNEPSTSMSFSSQESATTRASDCFLVQKLTSSKAAHSTLTLFLPTMNRAPARKDHLL